MPLNPQVAVLLEAMAQAPQIDISIATVAEVRAAYNQSMQIGEPLPVAAVRDLDISLDGRTLAARLYMPVMDAGAPPLTVYYHGGGWVIGTLDTHDATCRALARSSNAAVLSVGYRLAPEHPYPAPVEDCYDALVWAADNAANLGIDPDRLAVAGDSAGGNLAAAVAIMARDRSGPTLRHQCLIYPVTDTDFATTSYVENGGGAYFLSEQTMRWFWAHYLGDVAPENAPLARVIDTPNLAGLPPATMIAAEYDPLRDEGLAYAARLEGAGVRVDAAVAPGMIHGFVSMFEAVPDAMDWIQRAGANLAADLRS